MPFSVLCSDPSKGKEGIYPEDAIHDVGLDQKHENLLYVPKSPTLSDMWTHSSVIIPGIGWHPSWEGTRTETGNHTTYHAFQAMNDVDRRLVTRIGPTKITAASPGCLVIFFTAWKKSYMKATVSPHRDVLWDNQINATILGHTPKVESKQMERMATTLRSYFHRTIARHTKTTSLSMGWIRPSLVNTQQGIRRRKVGTCI